MNLKQLKALDERARQSTGTSSYGGGAFAQFQEALVNYWRSGGRELAEEYEWLRTNRWYVQVMSDLMDRQPKFCVIGTELSAAIRCAMSEDARRDHEVP